MVLSFIKTSHELIFENEKYDFRMTTILKIRELEQSISPNLTREVKIA